jgi:hypothetical protein
MMQMGVGQLEELFAKSKADPRVLKQLEHELGFRQVPRAMTLLGHVQTSLKAMAGTSLPRTAPPKSPEPQRPPFVLEPEKWVPEAKVQVPVTAVAPKDQAWPSSTGNTPPQARAASPIDVPVFLPPKTSAVVPVPSAAQTLAARPAPVPPSVPRPAAPPAPSTATPLLQISLEDACRILKVLPGDPWEQIEQSRRKLVMRSHPEKLSGLGFAQAQQARTEAMRVNDAYLVVAARRSGGQ